MVPATIGTAPLSKACAVNIKTFGSRSHVASGKWFCGLPGVAALLADGERRGQRASGIVWRDCELAAAGEGLIGGAAGGGGGAATAQTALSGRVSSRSKYESKHVWPEQPSLCTGPRDGGPGGGAGGGAAASAESPSQQEPHTVPVSSVLHQPDAP